MQSVLYEKRFDTGASAEVSEDFTLPDYQPEVRRVLGTRACAALDGKYLSGDELEADGSVTYTVCYMDGDGRVAEASETSPFTVRVPLKSGEDRYSPADLIVSAAADAPSCRVTGPRRFTLSSRVRVSVLSQRPLDLTLASDGLNLVRRRVRTVRTACLVGLRGSFEVSGEIREGEKMRIVGAQGAVSFSDVRTADGRLTMRGEASIRILLASEEGETVVSRGRAAIEETMELPELPPEVKCRAAVFPSVVMTEAEAADDGTVSWRMEYDADTVLMKCGEGEITADAYSPDGPTEAGIRDCTSVAPAAAHNGRLTVSVRMNARPGASFLWAWGNAVCDRVTVQGGRAQASGTLRITAVSRAGEEILAEEISVPLRYEWEAVPDAADAEDGALSGRVAVTVTDIAARGGAAREDGEEWNLTAEAAVCAVLVAPENVRALVTLMPIDGEGCPDTKNVIRVYVPEADESPWDVEKKFRLGCEAVPSGGVYVI